MIKTKSQGSVSHRVQNNTDVFKYDPGTGNRPEISRENAMMKTVTKYIPQLGNKYISFVLLSDCCVFIL